MAKKYRLLRVGELVRTTDEFKWGFSRGEANWGAQSYKTEVLYKVIAEAKGLYRREVKK
jgi:hypothetical protein